MFRSRVQSASFEAFVEFSRGKVVSDDSRATRRRDRAALARTYRRIRIEIELRAESPCSSLERPTCPYPYGRELMDMKYLILLRTLNKATAARRQACWSPQYSGRETEKRQSCSSLAAT